MLNIHNPTDSVLKVQIEGQSYEIGPRGDLIVSDLVALKWKKEIHQFIEVSKPVEKKPEPEVVPEAEPKVEEKKVVLKKGFKLKK